MKTRTRCEEVIRECMIASGWSAQEADTAIEDLKHEAIESDSAWQIEATNLHNAKDEAVNALQTVLYNLRNA